MKIVIHKIKNIFHMISFMRNSRKHVYSIVTKQIGGLQELGVGLSGKGHKGILIGDSDYTAVYMCQKLNYTLKTTVHFVVSKLKFILGKKSG